VVFWRGGSALVSINEVNLHWVRLVLGWVTVFGFISQSRTFMYVTSHPGQLSLAIPLWVGAVITSQRAVMPCGWRVKAGVVCVCGRQVKLYDPIVTYGPYLSTLDLKGL